ncbi:hypothetical protein BASA50_010753 [Batrachochytrium salamandrivorans]|uniref:Uncharacterized protein n=1 Tax=Batrachochytrium salamandrivorans TaxID=1357716 RepID=A0ABQ8EXK1_9FUNG|nr:hypothetical protein BASA50_010753 [Batrachochytrium salamandrivorans]
MRVKSIKNRGFLSTNCTISSSNPNQQISPDQDIDNIIPTCSAMQFFTFFISAITVIASVHGAAIPIMDTPASPQEALETRSYNDPDSGSNLEKRSPGYGRSNFGNQMQPWNNGGFPQRQLFFPLTSI